MPTSKLTDTPINRSTSFGGWNGEVELLRLEFTGFNALMTCGARQSIFQSNPFSTNKTPMHKIVAPVLRNVQDDALVAFNDCSSGACSSAPGHENILISFSDVAYEG